MDLIRPKKLPLKGRTLNPANTICYVQQLLFFLEPHDRIFNTDYGESLLGFYSLTRPFSSKIWF
ncbi:hypothetical protein OROMI_007345 [Orobanche minor]